MLVELNEKELELAKKVLGENVNSESTMNFKEWTEKAVESIDDTVSEYLEDNAGDGNIDDEELYGVIGDQVSIIVSTACKGGSLQPIIIRELVDGYVDYMFRNWYTGEKEREDYYLGVLEYIEE